MTRDEEKPVIHLKHQSRSRLHRLAIQRRIEAEEEIKRFRQQPEEDDESAHSSTDS